MTQTSLGDTYRRSTLRTYRMYKDLGERAIAQVTSDGDLRRQIDPEALRPPDLERTVTIRMEEFLVVEALDRSVAHTAYHVGQIVYVARHLAAPSFKSLSIPKGQSAEVGAGTYKRQ